MLGVLIAEFSSPVESSAEPELSQKRSPLSVHNFLQQREMRPLAKTALVWLAFPINAHQNAN